MTGGAGPLGVESSRNTPTRKSAALRCLIPETPLGVFGGAGVVGVM